MVCTSLFVESPNLDSILRGLDKVLHFLLYFSYGISIQIMLVGNFSKKSDKFILITTLIIGLLLGAIDEWIQSYQSLRTSDIKDFFADSLGVISSLLWYIFIKRLK